MPADEFEKTFLCKEGTYHKFVSALRQKYHTQTGSEQIPKGNSPELAGYKAILDSLQAVIYVADKQNLELLYMNAEAKQVTGIDNYSGCKCFQVLTGRAEPCEQCVLP